MNDAVRKFRSRRAKRMELKAEDDPVSRYRARRYNRLRIRLDAEESEENKNGNGGGHGNTRIPFGLCQREGVQIQEGWTPSDAWNALEDKGYKASEVYSELRKTGKVESKPKSVTPKMSIPEATKASKGFQKTRKEINGLMMDLNSDRGGIEKYGELAKRHAQKAEEAEKEAKRIVDKFGNGKDAESLTGYARDEYDLAMERSNAMKKRSEEEQAFYDKINKRCLEREKKIKEIKESEEYKKYKDAIMTKFPTYDECTTTAEVKERLDLNEYFKDNSSSFARISADSAKALAKEFDTFFEKVPQMRGKLGSFELCSMTNWGESWPNFVKLNSKYYGDRKMFEQQVKYSTDIGFHPKGTTVAAIMFHEYTHQIDDYMTKKLGLRENFSDVVYNEVVERLAKSKSKLLEGIDEKMPAKYTGEKREELRKALVMERVKSSVSGYAYKTPRGSVHKDHVEFFAEAYSEFLDSKNPSEVARIVGDIVKEYFKKSEV